MEMYGTWWRPEFRDLTVNGTLRQQCDGRITLALDGGFKGKNQKWDELPGWPLLNGSSDGKDISLIACRVMHESGSLRGQIRRQVLSIHQALIGIHLNDPGTKVFEKLTFEIENLYEFTRFTLTKPTERRRRNQFTRDGDTIRLSRSLNSIRNSRQRLGVVRTTTTHASISVTPAESGSVASLLAYMKSFQDLVSLATQKPCALLKPEFTVRLQGRPSPVKVARQLRDNSHPDRSFEDELHIWTWRSGILHCRQVVVEFMR